MAGIAALNDVTGFRGEKIVELCLTEYSTFAGPLFRPAFLGDKWPAVDFYVELTGLPGRRPYFLVQAKSTAVPLPTRATSLRIPAVTKAAVARLLAIPGPTYVLGVHEPTRRVFARSVHPGGDPVAITRVHLRNELTPVNLRRLHDEVSRYWRRATHKPSTSVFT